MLVDRGGDGGERTFVEAAAMAADAVAAVLVPSAPVGGGSGAETPHCCRCVGVIVANDRTGRELFSMAPPKTEDGGASGTSRRAPFPVVMVSRESGQLLKDTLSTSAVAGDGCGDGDYSNVPGEVPWEGYRERWQWGAWGVWDGGPSYGMDPLAHLEAVLNDNLVVADGVVVSLGASENCRALDASVCGTSSTSPVELESTCAVHCTTDDDNYTTATDTSVDEAAHYGSQPHPVSSAWAGGAGAELKRRGKETGGEAARWERGRMLYGAQTLPVTFKIS